MPRITRVFGRKVGPLGIALTAWDIWRRLPESQRRLLLAQSRKHGPRLASAAVKHSRSQLRKRRPR